MTVPKAIEYLEIMLRNYDPACPFDEVDALKLGIEALKELRALRKTTLWGEWKSLPGETDETIRSNSNRK